MGAQMEQKSKFFTAFEHREKEPHSLFFKTNVVLNEI